MPPNASAAEVISSPPDASASPARLLLAGFWRRAVACLIDTILIVSLFLLWALLFPSTLVKLLPPIPASFTDPPQPVLIAMTALFAALQCAYYTVFEGSSWQATPGKRVMRLYVTNLNGQRITFGRALLRSLARQISGFLFIGYLVAGLTEKKQALHDILTSCLVLRRP